MFRFNLSVTRKNAFVSTQAISNELFLLLIFWCVSLCEKKKERKRNRNTRSVSFCQMSSQFTLKHVFLTFNNLTRGFPLKWRPKFLDEIKSFLALLQEKGAHNSRGQEQQDFQYKATQLKFRSKSFQKSLLDQLLAEHGSGRHYCWS